MIVGHQPYELKFIEEWRFTKGLFDKFKNEKKENKIINASGWDAIDEEAKRIYPGQDNPKHYEPLIKWCFGGSDPLDGISVYDGGDYWHFVTYGL